MRSAVLGRGASLSVALLGALFTASCDRPKDEPPPVRPVLSRVVEPVSDQVFGPFAGSVQPRYKTDLGFRASGRMIARNANLGDQIPKDFVLASLDPRVAALSLASARADLANSQAQLVNAAGTEQRQSTLLQTGATAQSQVDSAVANRDTAKAKVNQAEAALTKAQEQLDYMTLRPDFAGVITNWSVEVGQLVSSGQTVVTVARPDQRDAVFDVPDDLIGKVAPGSSFTVSLQADLGVTTEGVVREIAPEADAATRTRRVKMTLPNAPNVFRLGTTVTITLKSAIPPIVTLPTAAILEKDGKASVWLASQDGKAEPKDVVIGARDGDTVTVSQGLEKGDRVIVAGVHSLSAGQPIKLLGH